MSSVSSLNSLLSSSSTSGSSSLNISSLLAAATGSSSTGIDVTSAVDAAIYAAQAPERQWQAQQSTIKSQIAALSSIQSATNSLKTDLQVLSDPAGAMTARTVDSSNPASVAASAAAGTPVATHTISVSALATSASWYSAPIASANSPLGSSTLSITKANGTQANFALGGVGTASLSALVKSINVAGLGYTASVIQDAAGARLSLVGNSTGDGNDFSVSSTTSSVPVWTSADVSAATTSLSANFFQVSDGSSTANIQVAAGDTLGDVANQINAQGLNLTASVVNDGSGSHLSISANGGQPVTVTGDPVLQMNQVSQAKNASLTVDGVPLSSASDVVKGALSGVTLNLGAATGSSPVTLQVAPDSNQIQSTISQFVTDYNSAISQINAQFSYSASTSSEGVLGSDASIRTLQGTLLGFTGFVSGSGSAPGGYSTLASLGITVQDDGTLSLNSQALAQAIAADSQGVQNFFQGASGSGFAKTMQAELDPFTTANVGTLASDLTNLNQQYNSLQSDVDAYESGYIASQKTLLTTMYSNAEIALQSLPTTLKQLQAELNGNSGS